MTFVQLDDMFADHPKFAGLSDAGVAAWIRGLCYSSCYLTDGALPRAMRSRLGTPRAVAELVERGIWHATDQGWQVHDYSHHQRTRAEVESIVLAKVDAGTLGNHKRWHEQRGLQHPDCRYCRIAEGSQMRSQTESLGNRKRSPESESETETGHSPKKPLPAQPSTGPVDKRAAASAAIMARNASRANGTACDRCHGTHVELDDNNQAHPCPWCTNEPADA